MADILTIVLPVFGLIGLGYFAAATSYLSRESGDGLTSYVFSVAVPVLLFRSLATAEFPDINPWAFWASYFMGIACVWSLAALLIRRGFTLPQVAQLEPIPF